MTKPETAAADLTLGGAAEPQGDETAADAKSEYIGDTINTSLNEDYEVKDRRQTALFNAAKALSGTSGVTAKGLLYLAHECEQYLENGYDAAKGNG